ncbi:hypothetical protein STENM327S_07134 [Streptomyces tendae]
MCAARGVTEWLEDYIGPMTVVALTVLATVTVLSASLCVVRRRAESRFRRVQAVAEAVQLALLRPLPADQPMAWPASTGRRTTRRSSAGTSTVSARRRSASG